MTVFSFRVFSAQNLLDQNGNQAFSYNSINANNVTSGTYITGGENSFFISVDDTGDGTGTGNNFTGLETVFDDGPNASQVLAEPATFTYLDQNGTIVTTTFPAGTQIQAEFQQSFSNGTTIIAIRVADPSTSSGFTTVGYTFDGPPPPPGTVLGSPTSAGSSNAGDIDYSQLACFTAGIMIKTVEGPRPIEAIKIGDVVLTHDNGGQPVTWVGRTHVPAAVLQGFPNLRPVTVPKGAFGAQRDLQFSRNHRVLVRCQHMELFSGHSEMLAAVGHFERTVQIAPVTGPVAYYHLACAEHQIIGAEGMLVETMLVIPDGQGMLRAEAETGNERLAVRPILKRWEVSLIDDVVLHGKKFPEPA